MLTHGAIMESVRVGCLLIPRRNRMGVMFMASLVDRNRVVSFSPFPMGKIRLKGI